MKFIKNEWLNIFLIAILAAVSVKALAIPEFYTSHDGETHTARLANFALALQEGQIPPQLAPTLFGGFGFPIFIFIYPLPYFVGSLFYWLGLSYTDSAELTMAAGQILSAVAIYLFFKLETNKTLPSLLGAIFFTFAPYRFLMIFVRGAFAESFAYIFIATTLICLNRLSVYRNKQWMGLLAFSIGGLLLSHQLVSIMFLPVITWYVLTKLIDYPYRKEFILRSLISLVIGFGLAAYIYAPAFWERQYLRFDDLIDYTQDHFVTARQLIRSPWSYGFSHKGIDQDDMSFQIGLTHLAAIALATVSFIVLFWKKRTQLVSDLITIKMGLWLLVFYLAAAIMIEHPINHQLWQVLPGLHYVDFPWRFIGVTVVAASMAVVYLLKKTKSNLFLVIFLGFFVFYANRNHLRINQSVSFSDEHFENYPATATWQNEFLPKERGTNKWERIEGDYQVVRGQAEIIEKTNKTHRLDLEVTVSEPAELLIHRLYFPGWRVFINEQEISTEDEQLSISNSEYNLATETDLSGFIKVKLNEGKHHLRLLFTPTFIRLTGQVVSLISVGLGLYMVFSDYLITKKHQT